jgi:hypothetical protein
MVYWTIDYQVHIFLWIVPQGQWDNAIGSKGIINDVNMMCKVKNIIINFHVQHT